MLVSALVRAACPPSQENPAPNVILRYILAALKPYQRTNMSKHLNYGQILHLLNA